MSLGNYFVAKVDTKKLLAALVALGTGAFIVWSLWAGQSRLNNPVKAVAADAPPAVVPSAASVSASSTSKNLPAFVLPPGMRAIGKEPLISPGGVDINDRSVAVELRFPDFWLFGSDAGETTKLFYQAPFSDNSNAKDIFGPRLIGVEQDALGQKHPYETPRSAAEAAWMDRQGFLAPTDFTSTISNSQLMALVHDGNLRAMNLLAYRAIEHQKPMMGNAFFGYALSRGSLYSALLNARYAHEFLGVPRNGQGVGRQQMQWLLTAQRMGDSRVMAFMDLSGAQKDDLSASTLLHDSALADAKIERVNQSRSQRGAPPLKPDPRPGG
jgi:hypothetical protein